MSYYRQAQAQAGPSQPVVPSNAITPNLWANQYAVATFQQQGYHYTPPYPPLKTQLQVPSPPLLVQLSKSYRYWDTALKSFLTTVGLKETLKGLSLDLMVLNSECEEQRLPSALDELVKNIQSIRSGSAVVFDEPERSLDERKLDYVKYLPETEHQVPSSVNKSISQFLSQSRARNSLSNQSEFLLSLEERAKRSDSDNSDNITCARADAKYVERDTQIKYDIAVNEDGPLRRTLRKRKETPGSDEYELPETSNLSKSKGKQKSRGSKIEAQRKASSFEDEDEDTKKRHPGLDQRLENVESHLAVRYVPSPPRTLTARLKFLEDHIIRLEKEYPPWAALHFNQPNRGWPPPPRSTPIIVPPELLDSKKAGTQTLESASLTRKPGLGANPKARNTGSSLHRAILEQLQVKAAKEDIQKAGNSSMI